MTAGRRTAAVVGTWLLLAGVAGTVPAVAAKERPREELINFQLGPEYSQWLVGAISRIATEREVDAYLALTDDEAAAAFIEEFWSERRNPDSPWPDDQPRAIFERRAEAADRLYSEGARLGRFTDRGTIYILYGEPADVRFELPARGPRRGREEIWVYPKDAPRGLDGRRPKKVYVFVERDGLTVRR